MNRLLLAALATFASSAHAMAWEARAGRICELTHDGQAAFVRLTYDPAIPQYSIAVTPREPWANGAIFAMQFDGARPNRITTDRHVLTDDGSSVEVTDRGFGNVLNGLEFNQTATALLGDRAVSVSLAGAAPAVQAFRACASGVGV